MLVKSVANVALELPDSLSNETDFKPVFLVKPVSTDIIAGISNDLLAFTNTLLQEIDLKTILVLMVSCISLPPCRMLHTYASAVDLDTFTKVNCKVTCSHGFSSPQQTYSSRELGQLAGHYSDDRATSRPPGKIDFSDARIAFS
jgi:hypothetical protein